MRLKAFIFTLDALFALTLMIMVSTSVFVFSQQSVSDARLKQLNQLGRDYLELQALNLKTPGLGAGVYFDLVAYETDFSSETMVELYSTFPANKQIAVKSVLYKYPDICGVITSGYRHVTNLDFSLNCLTGSQRLNEIKQEVWVSPK